MQLNIIGNGFDLYHGLPSSYYFFGCYLIKNDPKFYEELGEMYNFKFAKMIGPPIGHDYEYVVEDIFWREFEKHLGEVDENFIIYTHDDDLNLENDDPIDIEMNEDMIAEKLKQAFVHWVKDTLDQNENYELIIKSMKEVINPIKFNCDDYFLNFNYTHTLQKIYDVPDERIHYVHGECLGDDDELIIGHGNDERIIEIEGFIYELESKYNYTQSSKNEINEYECLLRILKKLRKNVNSCKVYCDSFFKEIGDGIKIINVFGMSLGDVDIPYLKHIREKWPNAQWKFSYYSYDDKVRIIEVAENELILNKEDYNIFKFSNTRAREIKEKIIELQDITKY
ncbi:AbiH family protein [Clostridium neonatale]|uniref:AbiH family protein n=1 Tax=Clostridium neonatale TaxID=137838 RepID=UPI003D358DFF